MNYLLCSVLIGIVATMLLDLWGVLRQPLLGVPRPDYAPVGRWFALMAQGNFLHQSIAAARRVRGESLIGWLAHYLVGIAFAGILVAIWGNDWLSQPKLTPALVVGIGSVAAPFLVMQPAMGAGIAGAHTPNPAKVRLQSLVTHTIFGLALYVAGWLLHFVSVTN